jgi:hypothetical protein
MSKKIGRNDPCPCGSGKKYKHCCMRSDELKDLSARLGLDMPQSSSLDVPKIKNCLQNHDAAPIIDYLIALQLNPDNHGKNLRLEHLCQLAVSSLGKNNVKPDLRVFKRLIDEEYHLDVMEDIPMNMFCENVIFHGGNYFFFTGLSTHVSELFRAMAESIFQTDKIFSDKFKKEIYNGVTLILELGNAIANKAEIKRMTRGNDNPREAISEPLSRFSCAIPTSLMEYVLNNNRLEKSTLQQFLLDKNDPNILTQNAEENPILYKPILKWNDNYYFIGLNNQGCAINNYILKKAIEYSCINDLVQQTQLTIWARIGLSCMNVMHWTPIEFDGFLSKDDHYNDCLFRIDVNWVAYLCYVTDIKDNISVDGANGSVSWNIDSRLKCTLKAIRENEKMKDFHILTLVLYSSMGEKFMLMMKDQPDSDYLLYFSAFDFLQLVQTEKWDSMSLVRYARTKENTSALKLGMNQPLDCYSMYKQKGESFYFSDDRKPDYIQIEPNEGCKVIHESKEKLDYHGTLMHTGEYKRYIPVQRDIDYESIYKPLNESVNAKCCESYRIPVWVRCRQTEQTGVNPSSITETVITAIAFWMDKLCPAIEGCLLKLYKDSIEIDLHFSPETLADKSIHYEILQPAGNGKIVVTHNATGAVVSIDDDFVRGFMGPDNNGERQMMKKIVSCLLDCGTAELNEVIDTYIPLGPAKMILMMEASNNPLSYPLWLHPPISIHQASSQLILDFFPQWMAEKGYDIEGRLSSKEQKDDFLHKGVDVLLEKLAQYVGRFESRTLLERLIGSHETLTYQREHNKIIHPAQIHCFGDSKEKREEFFKEENRLTETGTASRALIEYVAANQCNKGKEQAGSNDIEWLLSIMSQIIHIGSVCDAVHLGVSDHKIEKLASGRYGIYDDSFNDMVGGFVNARSAESVNSQIEGFEDKMEHFARIQPDVNTKRDSKLDEIDKAFQTDWGISYTQILQILYSSYVLAMKKKRSVIDISEKDFTSEVMSIWQDLDENTISSCLDRLSLDKRLDYLKPPSGLDAKDIFPWVYNRELSYLRRPYVRWQTEDGSQSIIFAFRSCLLAGLQLTDLLYSGRLKNVGKRLSKLLGKFEAEKGKAYNEEVRAFLQKNSSLKVWKHDVSIKPKGNLAVATNDDLGDIDVLAYDEKHNIIYPLAELKR